MWSIAPLTPRGGNRARARQMCTGRFLGGVSPDQPTWSCCLVRSCGAPPAAYRKSYIPGNNKPIACRASDTRAITFDKEKMPSLLSSRRR